MRFVNLCVVILFTLCISCSKNNSGSGTTTDEENLQIAINPDPAGSLVKALSDTYTFDLIIKTRMPPQGVDVTVTCKKDLDNSVVFSQALQTSTTPLQVTIKNLTTNDVCTATINVQSRSKTTNNASLSFKVAKK
jgi:hypothetical protein